MSRSRHRDLRAYGLCAQLADEIHAVVAAWPSFERRTIGVQLVRSIDSVGANIAEAFGCGSTPDLRRLLFIARGSLLETEHWIDRATARGLVEPARFDRELEELARIMTGLLRSNRIAPA